MRRLNLLKQILRTVGLGASLSLSPMARLVGVTMQTINSRRGWREWIAVSERDLLDECGYIDSAHSRKKLKAAIQELKDARIIDVKLNGQRRCTEYRLVDLSSDIASAAISLGNVAVAGSLNFNGINGKTAAELSTTNVKHYSTDDARNDADIDADADAHKDADADADRRREEDCGGLSAAGNTGNIGNERNHGKVENIDEDF